MKDDYRNRHCYAKKDGDRTRYFAVYGKDTVEIEKDVYDCLRESYSREWQLEKIERKHKGPSLDQIVEDIEREDHHGKIPDELLVSSAEDVFMEGVSHNMYLSFLDRFSEQIESMPEDDRLVLMTFLGGPKEIAEVAEMLGIAYRTVYYRRVCLAEKLAAKLRKEYRK